MDDVRTFKIDKGIPIPGIGNKHSIKRTPIEWPFDKMRHGDSILVPHELINAARVRLTFERKNKLAGKFATRNVDGGMRIWRLK